MYAPPNSPVTTSKSFAFAPERETMELESAMPMAVILNTNPALEEVVSPPTKSTPYTSQAFRIPAYISSTASTENRLLKAIETVICVGKTFIAQMSERLTTTAL